MGRDGGAMTAPNAAQPASLQKSTNAATTQRLER
jgi:hypothetical protein